MDRSVENSGYSGVRYDNLCETADHSAVDEEDGENGAASSKVAATTKIMTDGTRIAKKDIEDDAG